MHFRPLSSLVLAALALPLAVAAPAAPAAQDTPADPARLLPADAVLVLRMESTDALVALAQRFAGEPVEDGSAEEFLRSFDLPGDPGQVDGALPLWMAVSVTPQMPSPMVTFVLPVTDAEAYRASLEDSPRWTTAVAGGYVGASQVQGYAPADAPSPLAGLLRPGMVSAHLDLDALITAFRPFIEMGLEQAAMQVDTLAQMSEGPMDIGPLLELYLDMAWDFVDSAEGYDLTLVEHEGSVELNGWLTVLENSPMAAWGEGNPSSLGAWPARLATDSTLVTAMGGDWVAMMERMQPLLDVAFGIYPEGTRDFFRQYMAATESLLPLMGPAFVSGDIGSGGMRLGYVVRTEQPAEVIEAMDQALAGFAGGEGSMGISISAPEAIELGGVQARRRRLDIDYEAMAESLGEELGEGDTAQMTQAMEALYGKDGLSMTLAAGEKELVLALGGDDAFAASLLAAPAGASTTTPAELQRAMAAADGGTLAFVYRFDLGRLLEQIGELAAAFGEDEAELEGMPTDPLPMTMWASIRGRTWAGGLSVDPDAFGSFIRAAQEADASQAEEPYVFDIMEAPEDSSTQAVVRAEMALIEAGCELYALNNNGHYPDSLEELVALDENGESYLDEIPLDPWGNPYVYTTPQSEGDGYHLTCYGSDGAPGGEGEAADVVVHLPH